MKKIILAFTSLLIISACATAGTPKAKDQNLISKIEKGITTQDQIYAMFGEPQMKTKTEEGLDKWGYAYAETQVTGATFIPVVGLFAGGANSNVSSVEIEFDNNLVVKKFSTSTGKIKSQNFGNTDQKIEKVEH